MGYSQHREKLKVSLSRMMSGEMVLWLLCFVFLASTDPLIGQTLLVDESSERHWGIGLSWRILGHKSLGFYSFQQTNPALQVVYNLSDETSLDAAVRLGGQESDLIHVRLVDLSAGYRRWVGMHRRSFFRIATRRAFISTEWQLPLEGKNARHHWGLGVGFGRKFRILNERKWWLIPQCSYEVLVDRQSAWFGRLHLDLVAGYSIGSG